MSYRNLEYTAGVLMKYPAVWLWFHSFHSLLVCSCQAPWCSNTVRPTNLEMTFGTQANWFSCSRSALRFLWVHIDDAQAHLRHKRWSPTRVVLQGLEDLRVPCWRFTLMIHLVCECEWLFFHPAMLVPRTPLFPRRNTAHVDGRYILLIHKNYFFSLKLLLIYSHYSDPFIVLVLSLSFIGSIFFLHISAKIIRAFAK